MKPIELWAAALVACAATPAGAKDGGVKRTQPEAAGAAPMAVEFENDAVQVIRIRFAPHQKIPMHDVTPRVVVWLTEAHLRLTAPDGATTEQHPRAGEIAWLPAQRHAGENLGDRPIELIAVIPKAR